MLTASSVFRGRGLSDAERPRWPLRELFVSADGRYWIGLVASQEFGAPGRWICEICLYPLGDADAKPDAALDIPTEREVLNDFASRELALAGGRELGIRLSTWAR